MKKLFIRTASAVALLVAALLIYSIYDPYIAWFCRVSRATVTIDGKLEEGWLHRETRGRAFVLTHGSGQSKESYMVTVIEKGRGAVWKCGDWIAPRFPVFSMGDVNPPCMNIVIDDGTMPKPRTPDPPRRDLRFGDGFLEFTLADGRFVKATW